MRVEIRVREKKPNARFVCNINNGNSLCNMHRICMILKIVDSGHWVTNRRNLSPSYITLLHTQGGILTGFEDIGLHINIGCKIFVCTLAYIGYKGLSILDSCNVKSCTMWDPNMLSYLHHGNQGPDVGKFKSEFPSDFS